MSIASAVGPDDHPRPWSPGARLGVGAGLALMLLAAVESAQAVIAPWRAPVEADWIAAAGAVRSGFHAGDLIVAAPEWADPLMRMHVGDLLPLDVVGRMDDARYARVWTISQRRARAVEERGRVQTYESRFGALTVRRFERRPAVVTFDALASWRGAYVTHWNPASRKVTPCPWQGNAFVCPTTGSQVRKTLVEIDQAIRAALLAPPVQEGIISVEFPSVTLGQELVVAAGLHDTWARKSPGSAYLEIWIAGERAGGLNCENRSGWRTLRIDTAGRDGQQVPVRFQISSPRPLLRNLSFAAEARR